MLLRRFSQLRGPTVGVAQTVMFRPASQTGQRVVESPHDSNNCHPAKVIASVLLLVPPFGGTIEMIFMAEI